MPHTKTVKSLTEILANSYILLLKKQNYHWNVKGENFVHLHQLFGTQYEEQFTAIDEIAERIRSLGAHTAGSFSEYSELSKIKEERTVGLASQQMLKNLILDENTIITILTNSIKAAQEEGDEASVDLMIGRTKIHQKNLWMLESSLAQ